VSTYRVMRRSTTMSIQERVQRAMMLADVATITRSTDPEVHRSSRLRQIKAAKAELERLWREEGQSGPIPAAYRNLTHVEVSWAALYRVLNDRCKWNKRGTVNAPRKLKSEFKRRGVPWSMTGRQRVRVSLVLLKRKFEDVGLADEHLDRLLDAEADKRSRVRVSGVGPLGSQTKSHTARGER
jgi:hypothetical protein